MCWFKNLLLEIKKLGWQQYMYQKKRLLTKDIMRKGEKDISKVGQKIDWLFIFGGKSSNRSSGQNT